MTSFIIEIPFFWTCTKQRFTCSKSAIETLAIGVEYAQSEQKRHQNDIIDIVLVFLLLTLNMFHIFFLCLYC